MKILIGCEFSGIVREAFRKKGHVVYSCDLDPSTDNSPYHIQDDVFNVLLRESWDMLIAFPPCTHLCSSGARWFAEKRNDGRQIAAINFFLNLASSNVPKICIENPIGIMSSRYRKPDQIVQPWQFGHPETKATCFWLKNLPILKPTNIVKPTEQRIWRMPPSKDRSKLRSIFFSGIAEAMAEQWG
jgi:site-specific DNA-cytosine methylase